MSHTPKVLVVDDEPQILRVLRPSLTASGYDVISAASGAEALQSFQAEKPDLVILDLGLPDMDGKEVLRKLRIVSAAPVIVLSARDREAEKVRALDLGADDYVEKPFGMDELLARMRSALRRNQNTREPEKFECGGLKVDIGRRLVERNGQALKLTPKEFELLVFFVRHAGRPAPRREILRAVWGPAHDSDNQTLRVFIGQLRSKIELDPSRPQLLTTEPGIGYRFHD